MLPLVFSTHMCLPTAGLPIGKTSSHPPLKDGGHQRPRCELVHHLIGCRVVKRVVKAELMVLEVLCEVHLSLWLVDLTAVRRTYTQYQWMMDHNIEIRVG